MPSNLLRAGGSGGDDACAVLPSDGVFSKLTSSGLSMLHSDVVPDLVLVDLRLAVLLLGAWSTGNG